MSSSSSDQDPALDPSAKTPRSADVADTDFEVSQGDHSGTEQLPNDASPAASDENAGTHVEGTMDYAAAHEPEDTPQQSTDASTHVEGTVDYAAPRPAEPKPDNDAGKQAPTHVVGTVDYSDTCDPAASPKNKSDKETPTHVEGTVDYPRPSDAGGEAHTDVGATGDWQPGGPHQGTEQEFELGSSASAQGDSFGATVDFGPAAARGVDGLFKDEERYNLKKFHAKGGMGEIWLAEDRIIGRSVALKRMLHARESHVAPFVLEAQITGQLEHPGIVPVHELGLDKEGKPFYVMKFVHGRTFKEAIDAVHQGRPNLDEPAELQHLKLLNHFVDVCQTIAYAHSRGVIHRDIKPDNVMLGPYGETLVLDWGIAKVVGEPEKDGKEGEENLSVTGDYVSTQMGTIKGSPFYLSPEVAFGRVDQVDEKSDIYLLGGTLYHALTGQHPRVGNKMTELLEMARKEEPVAPRKLKQDVPRPLEAICMKALAFEKADRYETAVAMAEDVQRFIAGEPVSAYRENFRERAWRWCKKRQVLLGRVIAAGLILGMVAFGLGKWKQFADQREQERQASADRIKLEQAERERATAEADRLQRERQAKQDVAEFRRLADEMRYFAANSNEASEKLPFFDVEKGIARAGAALAVAEKWGPDLQKLPLPGDREALKKDLHNLLLLTAQLYQSRGTAAENARARLALLARAAKLGAASVARHRLRANCFRDLGEKDKAIAEERIAESGNVALTGLDHFVLGEEHRRRGADLAKADDKEPGLVPDQEQLHRALAEYRNALKMNPNDYWAHYQVARCHLSAGRTSEAVEAFGACIALKPESPWSYSVRGLALARLKRYDEARADFEKALSLDADFRPPRLNRGITLLLQKQEEAALKDLAAILQGPEEKKLIQAAFYRGQIRYRQGKFQEALDDYNAAIAGNLHNRFIYRERAKAQLALGNDREALDDLLASSPAGKGLEPNSARAHAEKGHQLRLLVIQLPPKVQGQALELALAELGKAHQMGERSIQLFDDLGSIFAMFRQWDEALAACTEVLKKDAKNVKALVKRGWVFERLQPPEHEKALADFKAALAIDPTHAEASTGAGYVQALLKKPYDAIRHANQAQLQGGGDYLILHNVACIYAQLSTIDPRGRRDLEDLALDQLRRAVELWKDSERGPDEIVLIRGESAFSAQLRARPEFKKLIDSSD